MKRVVSLVGFVAILLAPQVANASLIWAVDNLGTFNGGTVGDRVITFDSASPGSVTVVGATGVADVLMSGLDFDQNGTLYSYGWDSFAIQRGLYTIDQETGAATSVGAGGVFANYFIDDLSFDTSSNTMYAVANYFFNVRPCQLYKINLGTGMAQFVGDIAGTTGATCVGLSTDSAGTHYVHDILSDRMFSVSGLSATPMPLAEGFDASFSQGMTIERGTGTWYHGAFNNTSLRSELWTVNAISGAGTNVDNIGGFNDGTGFTEYQPGDIAIFPEPCAGMMMLLGLAALSRRSRH
jgi:hypothetical protein